MKKSTVLMSMLLSTISAASADGINTSVVVAPIPVTHIYSPLGFDSNDNVEVIVKGYLPNLCYRAPNTKTQVNGQTIEIQVTALHPSANVMCAQIAMPYLEAAQVGVLDKGDYGIVVNPAEPNSRSSSINIVAATSSAIDDNVYANVTSVERVPGTRTVFLKGTNPVDCYELAQIKSFSNGKDTYSVLPIMKQVSATCNVKSVAFSYKWDVPTDLSSIEQEPLLHVRVMNGKSFNTLFDEQE